MNFRLTAILFGTIFVLGLVLLILSFTGDTRPPADIVLEELAATDPKQVDTIEFEREGGARLKIVRDKNPEQWNIVEPYTAKADGPAVQELVAALLKAKPTPYPGITNNPAVYGLQPAGLKVTLRHGERSSTVNLGNVTLGGKGVVFVTTSARPKRPMAVPRGSFDALFRDPNKDGVAGDLARWVGDFRFKKVFPTAGVGGDDVTGVTLSVPGKPPLSLAPSGRGGWVFTSPAGWGEADPVGDSTPSPSFTGVRPLLNAVTSLQALSAADFQDDPKDLATIGLNPGNPEMVTVDLLIGGQLTTAYIGKKDGAAAPPAPGRVPEFRWWVKVKDQPGVVRASAGDLSGLIGVIQNPDPLRDRNLLVLDVSRIDGLDLANGAVKLRKVGTPQPAWTLFGNAAAGDPQPAVPAEVNRVIGVFTERRTVRAFPPENPANFGAGDVVVKLWMDGFALSADPKAEPKERGKPVTLTFGKKEGDSAHVRREMPDGKKEYFLLPEKIKVGTTPQPADLLATANTSRLDLLSKDLKGFSTTNVAKLTVMGAANFDLDAKEYLAGSTAPVAWQFAAESRGAAGQLYKKGDQADAQVVQGMLDILATTPSATRIVDEAPTAEKLAGYGLGTATKLRVIVGLKGTLPEDKERVYEFGNETPDTGLVYAQQRGRQAVLALPKFIYDKFPGADLRDRQVFAVDQSQVARVEITGWGHVFGKPDSLVVEKKDGVWVAVKAPTAGFVADTNKVIGLLHTLNGLQVRAFTADNTIEAKHGMDDKQVFVVTLSNSTGGHHMYLRLGGPVDGDATKIYAMTNRVPDAKPLVVLDAGPFKAFKEAPAALAK